MYHIHIYKCKHTIHVQYCKCVYNENQPFHSHAKILILVPNTGHYRKLLFMYSEINLFKIKEKHM